MSDLDNLPDAKRARLLSRAAAAHNILERLTADLPGELVAYADEARQNCEELVYELRKGES